MNRSRAPGSVVEKLATVQGILGTYFSREAGEELDGLSLVCSIHNFLALVVKRRGGRREFPSGSEGESLVQGRENLQRPGGWAERCIRQGAASDVPGESQVGW